MNFFSRANLSHHIIVITLLFLALSVGLVSILLRGIIDPIIDINPKATPSPEQKSEELEQSASEEEFRAYLSETQDLQSNYFGFDSVDQRTFIEKDSLEILAPKGSLSNIPKADGSGGAERVSQTNVQVKGIDEPDIVKTDGKHIYLSKEQFFFRELRDPIPFVEEGRIGIPAPEYYKKDLTSIINALPPETLEKLGSIDEQGQLLYVNGKLIVITSNKLTAYDVSNPRIPVESWSVKLDDQVSYLDARLYGDRLYLVTQTWMYDSRPCPIPLYTASGLEETISCTNIYHPVRPIPVDSTITISQINTQTGKVSNKTSFLGSSSSSIVYMSPQSLYITYTYMEDTTVFFYNFLKEEGDDLIPEPVMNKLKTLLSYDISNTSKLNEFTLIWESHLNTLSQDERRRVENEFENRTKDYIGKHARELETTGIVKVNRENLSVSATGSVPGHPLNQFSLDEYKDNLRIATTSQSEPGWRSQGSVNDVYVLDSNLSKLGSIVDLGLDERIYSVRFIGDRGYLVTFRETDPFYILDLSNPRAPQMTGELKIPGFSSYLHPIGANMILGVGRENNQVKLSMFDVSDTTNPIEADKYILDEYWTDVQNTHHAFLQDEKYNIFFIPGEQGGYIFKYDQSTGSMELIKAVSITQAKRALFLDNYLYIVGGQEIVVLDESNWERVSEFQL